METIEEFIVKLSNRMSFGHHVPLDWTEKQIVISAFLLGIGTAFGSVLVGGVIVWFLI